MDFTQFIEQVNAAQAKVKAELERAQIYADGNIFDPEVAKNCHDAVIAALNALKIVERIGKAQAAIANMLAK